jgi:hypothetical protein
MATGAGPVLAATSDRSRRPNPPLLATTIAETTRDGRRGALLVACNDHPGRVDG